MNNQREGEDCFYGVYGASNEGVLMGQASFSLKV